MESKKQYWKGLEQLKNTEDFAQRANKEFPEYLPLDGSDNEGSSRRDFLKMMGFGIGAVSLAACEAPVRKAIPWVQKPEAIDPGIPNYYASTYVSGSDVLSVLVKTREGRPIKIEGNTLSKVSGGGTTTQAEASVLSLYDKERLQGPTKGGESISWDELDQAVKALPASSRVAIVSNTISSPGTLKAIELFQTKYANTQHIQYDQVSVSGTLEANNASFGVRALPTYDFSKAKTIVSFASDFLGSSPSKALNNKQYAASRKLGSGKKDMSRLFVFESNLSLTGANADYRFPIKPSEESKFVLALYEAIVEGQSPNNPNLKMVVADLKKSGNASLVLAGSNDPNVQLLVNAINNALGSYGTTIDINSTNKTRQGDDKTFAKFVSDLEGGAVDAVIFWNCNPVYDHPLGGQIEKALAKVKFSLSTSDRMDETSGLTQYVAPDHHYLESWNDFQLTEKDFSLSQPTISKIFDTRQAQESLLVWAGESATYYDFIRSHWEETLMPQTEATDFDSFWDIALHDGVLTLATEATARAYGEVDLSSAKAAIGATKSGGGLELVAYENYSVGAGIQANNPWLQEMPDPITKACWDNYLTVSPKQAEEWGIEFGDMTTQLATLKVGAKEVNVPVMAQPGQAYNTIGLALGYGRKQAGKVANGVGVNAFELLSYNGDFVSYRAANESVTPTSESYRVAQTQTSQTYMGRETVVQETVLKKYQEDPQSGRYFPKIATSEGFKKPQAVSLWKGHKYANHHWGMAIDLNSCTGCGSCTVACQVENNIPVVGKQEVLNRREMHWIRIDRYYSSDAPEGDLAAMEKAAENPEVTFQPMMCQQCNNAPCETVCPVAATTHSSEGLNQMTYNRCIGTRYCANNCPYKVRRFNWFKYHDNNQFDTNLAMNNDLGKMVLNPDVTVRARGVMEKCSFCVQRIQSGKLQAKKEKRRPVDGEIQTACVSACPSEALVFGDMKDPESKISQLLQIKSLDKGVEAGEPRAYHVLEELRVMPNVWYLTKVRNKEEVEVKQEEASAPHA